MMKTLKDIYYTDKNDPMQSLDLYLPDTESFSLLVFFHGGGITAGDKPGDGEMLSKYLTDRGVALISANYRMYPSAKYPDFLCDAASAVAWAFNNIGKYGKCDKIFVGGSSAGGYISQMLCFDPRWLGEHGIDCASIAGYIHDAGQPTAHFNVLKFSGIDSRRIIIDETAPLYHVGMLDHYAPMLIIYSDNDMENRPEQTRLLISTLNHFRYDMNKIEVTVKHGKHCHYCFATDADGQSTFARMIYPVIEKYSN